MSEHIVLNGKTYLPSGDLAKAFSYTIDYLSRLAREGKVDAMRIGRQWFINPESLDSFIKDAEQKKVEQRAHLREERKREFQASAKNVTASADVAMPLIKSEHVIARDLVNRPYTHRRELAHVSAALSGTALVVFAGLLFAITITPGRFYNFASTYFVPAQDQQRAGAFSSREAEAPVVPGVGLADEVNQSLEQDKNGIVLLNGEASTAEVERVKQLFSDEVNVEFTAEDVGIITPVFKEKIDESYQFIMVPIKEPS